MRDCGGFNRFLALGLLVCSAFHLQSATTTFIFFGSPWRYNDFGEPEPNWFTAAYPDGDWKFNFGEFGYGDGDEQTETLPATTTYFRMFLTITNPQDYAAFELQIRRDDGVAVYVNGTEVLRDNLPTGTLTYDTLALTNIGGAAEPTLVEAMLSPSNFVAGVNLIAVEVHQASVGDPDMSFALQLQGTGEGSATPTITRGPYLQVGTTSNLIVRWRTSVPSSTRVLYGTDVANLNFGVSNETRVTDHEITLTRLLPDTKYFYSIGTSTQMLAGDATYFFRTSPLPGPAHPTRIWAIGDFGTGFPAQQNVRDAYYAFTGTRHTDAWLMLGDNAYNTGQDSEYQAFVFNVYPTLFRQAIVWPTVGNHETAFNQTLSDDYDYYRIFTMPKNGEAGGVASGTEHYYSYDYANIHFVCLDSMTTIFRQRDGPMAEWIRADLADTTQDWIIVYFHHPAYTKGSHDSDLEFDLIEMRENILPILESFGVDLVLSGHSHSYERSFLIDGHYGFSSSISEANFINHGDGRPHGDGVYLKPPGGMGTGRGMVYVVDGSSGGQGGGGSLNHPAMFYSVLTPGSLIIDINGLRLDATFLSGSGTVDDTFTILKGDFPNSPPPVMKVARDGTNAVISWPMSMIDYRLESAATIHAPQWSPVDVGIMTNGHRRAVSVPAAASNQFFQLRSVP
jgi:hypothetical protein